MKYLNLFFLLLFFSSAILQYNDPDPLLWIAIYLVPAWFSFQAMRNMFYPRAYIVTIVLLLFYALWLFFASDGVLNWINDHNSENIAGSMKATQPWIENTREFFGLLLIITSILINYFYSRSKMHGRSGK